MLPRHVVQGLRAKGIPTSVVHMWEQPSMFSKEHIEQELPSGRKFVDYEDMPITRGENFAAGIPREWENGKAPAWVRGDRNPLGGRP